MTWPRAAADRGRVPLTVDTEVGRDTIFGPDLQWFAADRQMPDLAERPWPVGDLVVEVASPSTARYDTETKLGRYLAAGVREVWLVLPDPLAVRIVRPDGERRADVGGSLMSLLQPGFATQVAALLE